MVRVWVAGVVLYACAIASIDAYKFDPECEDSENGKTDELKNGCDYYKGSETKWCGKFDTDEFKAISMCCACKGTVKCRNFLGCPSAVPECDGTVCKCSDLSMPSTCEQRKHRCQTDWYTQERCMKTCGLCDDTCYDDADWCKEMSKEADCCSEAVQNHCSETCGLCSPKIACNSDGSCCPEFYWICDRKCVDGECVRVSELQNVLENSNIYL